MELSALKSLLEEKGVAGAGGAGFPSHLKLDERAHTVILNASECEPLLNGDKLLLEAYSSEILTALALVVQAVGAERGIVAVKKKAVAAIEAVQRHLSSFDRLRLACLNDIYPIGDEVGLTYEITGGLVPQGVLPIEKGVVVFNVETMANIYRAVFDGAAVTEKIVTIAGEVRQPVTLRVPLGTTFATLIEAAGGITHTDTALIAGGVMTGHLAAAGSMVSKTTNAVLVLPTFSKAVLLRQSRLQFDLRRAFSVCSQCRMCTDLCPRALLGHDIAPHLLMRAVVNSTNVNTAPFMNALYCCGCGVCEMVACHQGLAPRKMIASFRDKLRENNIKPKAIGKIPEINPLREGRKISESRLLAALGLRGYQSSSKLLSLQDLSARKGGDDHAASIGNG